MIRALRASMLALAAVCPAGLTAAGAAAADFHVSVRFQVEAISFSAIPNWPYVTFPFLSVDGFTNPAHPGNYAELISPQNTFMSWVNGPHSASSSNHFDVESLKSNLDLRPWSLRITDGATAEVRAFDVFVNSSQLTHDYIRPLTIQGGIDNGSVISQHPTFEWSMNTTANPLAEYTSAFIRIYDPVAGRGYVSPLITPADRAWTPDGLVEPGTYRLVMGMSNSLVPQDLVVATAVPSDGGADLASFTTSVSAVTQLQLYDLHVVPSPGSIVLIALGGLVALRRRR